MRQIMDAGKVVLVDLAAKDPRVGKENAEAIGTLVVAMVWAAASSRVKETFPIPTSFWVDEFQTTVTTDFVDILAEARGFGLGLNLATQYYSRLPEWMQQAVLANCRTKVTGSIESPDEARLMRNIFLIDGEQLRTMDAYTYMVRVSAQRRSTDSFTMMGLPPLNGDKLRRAYMQANGGKMKTPADLGGQPFDFFEGVTPMQSEAERTAWEQHRRAMQGKTIAERAVYLAGLPEDDYDTYRALRRQVDKAEYDDLLAHSERIPDKADRIRRLSSLQVEVPRDEIEAYRLKLEASVKSATEEVGNLLSSNDLF
jgi:hypothetical protein